MRKTRLVEVNKIGHCWECVRRKLLCTNGLRLLRGGNVETIQQMLIDMQGLIGMDLTGFSLSVYFLC
jgi:hypothetical protein